MVSKFLIRLIRLYQRQISPLTPPSCRFHPSCSEYAIEALNIHGPIKGSWLAIRRFCRCHPLDPGGFDPVPHSMESGGEPRA